MASIADAGYPARRWSLTALLRALQPRTRAISAQEAAVEAPTELRTRRSYAPARDAFLETSAMRREMFRL